MGGGGRGHIWEVVGGVTYGRWWEGSHMRGGRRGHIWEVVGGVTYERW